MCNSLYAYIAALPVTAVKSPECEHFYEFNGNLYASTVAEKAFEEAQLECRNVTSHIVTFKTLNDFRIMRNAYGTTILHFKGQIMRKV